MSQFLKDCPIEAEKIAHDIVLAVINTSTQGFLLGRDYQTTDDAIANYAFDVYTDCYPIILKRVKDAKGE